MLERVGQAFLHDAVDRVRRGGAQRPAVADPAAAHLQAGPAGPANELVNDAQVRCALAGRLGSEKLDQPADFGSGAFGRFADGGEDLGLQQQDGILDTRWYFPACTVSKAKIF